MEDLKKSKEDLDSCYSDTDLTSQMREKIRGQASRLRALEQYRLLCEQRIQELSPGHPVPVKPEHLGSSSAELSQARSKIAHLESLLGDKSPDANDEEDYNDLLDKYNSLIKDKTDLEESLRAEMLTCEEQRTYIEVLKQAIESKTEHASTPLPRPESNKEFMKKPVGSKTPEESRREQTKIKNTLMDYESQVKRLQGLLKNKEIEIGDLNDEKKQLEGHLTQAAEALQIAEEEVDKLEEEKTNLLEYVDEHSLKEQEMERELNEVSRYFETMKKDFEKSKSRLDDESKARKQAEVKAEVLQEEVYKANQMVKELHSLLAGYKNGSEDRESAVKRLKEEKLAMEIKLESIQSNCNQLGESLKETQMELDEVQRQFEAFKRNETDKSTDLARLKLEVQTKNNELESIKAQADLVKTQLDEARKEHKELERMRELDIQQIQDFKANLGKFKAKCESLEESSKHSAELEQFRLLDEQKMTQLQEDFNYLQEVYRETQQRELIQSEALNELRKHNNDLSREVEGLYKENESLTLELNKKTQDLNTLFKKYEDIDQLCEAFEGDKKVLEMQLRGEKNSNKALKEQSFNDRSRLDEFGKELNLLQDSHEKSLRKSKLLEDEVQALKGKMKAKERECEEEKYRNGKSIEEVNLVTQKLAEKEKENEKMQGEIVECCKLVAGFSGKYTVTAHDYRSHISQGYKEFLLLWKDKISSSPKILHSWVQSTIEEIENLSKLVHESSKDCNSLNSEIKKLQSQLQGIHSEDQGQKAESQRLKTLLDQSQQKYQNMIESNERELNSLRTETVSCKREITCLLSELNSIKDLLKDLQIENHELKMSAEIAKSTIKTHEDRVSLIKNEKNQLESLLAQIQRTLGSCEISKIYNEIARIRGELEIVEREKINLECQMMKFDNDPRAKDSDSFRDLASKMVQCERQIRNFRKSMQILQDDANKEEMVQKLRTSDQKTLKSKLGNSSDPKTLSLMRNFDTVHRQKSSFS